MTPRDDLASILASNQILMNNYARELRSPQFCASSFIRAFVRALVCALIVFPSALDGSECQSPFVDPRSGQGPGFINTDLIPRHHVQIVEWGDRRRLASLRRQMLQAVSMTNRLDGKNMPVPKRLFALMVEDNAPITSGGMKVVSGPSVEKLNGNTEASRLAERCDGEQVTVELDSALPALHATWRIILRDGSNYFRQELTLTPRMRT